MRGLVALVAFGGGCFVFLFALVFVATGLLVLVGGPEGFDLFDWKARAAHGASRSYLLHAAIVVWVASIAHAAWLILGRPRVVGWPLVLGASIYPPLLGQLVVDSRPWHAAAAALIVAAWLACIVQWRWWREGDREGPGVGLVLGLLATVSLLHALLIGALLSEAVLPRFFTGPSVVLAFASWTLVGSLLFVLLPARYRVP